MSIVEPFHFSHENQAVCNWIKFLNTTDKLDTVKRAQYFMMSGIALGDCKLIEYSVSLDKNVVNTPVDQGILTAIDAVLSPVTGCNLSGAVDEVAQETPVDVVRQAEETDGPN